MSETENIIPTAPLEPDLVGGVPPLVTPITPPPQKIPTFLLFLIPILVVVAVISIYVMLQARSMYQQATSTPTPSQSPVASVDPTVDWKTYIDPKLSLEFKYPNDLSAKDLGNTVIKFEDEKNITKFNFTGYQIMTENEYSSFMEQEKSSGALQNPSNYVDPQQRTWLTYMNLGEVFNYTGILNMDSTYHVISLQSNFGEEADGGQSFRDFANQILSTFKFTDCTNNAALNLSVNLPKNWECVASTDRSDIGAVTLKSDFFSVEIADGARGPYCGDGGDPENLCKEDKLILSDNFQLTIFNYDGEDKELFGSLGKTSRDTNRWISVKYHDMESQKLTAAQKNDLLNLYNAMQFTN